MMEKLVEIGANNNDDENDNDFISDYNVLMSQILRKLDPSLRNKLNKRGIVLQIRVYKCAKRYNNVTIDIQMI